MSEKNDGVEALCNDLTVDREDKTEINRPVTDSLFLSLHLFLITRMYL